MTETRDLSNPFDRDRYSLSVHEIRKLCFILGGLYDVNPMDPTSHYPAFQICPAAFIRYLRVRLTDEIRTGGFRILDVRLAGGAASHIINPNSPSSHEHALDKFNDLDFVFNLEMRDTDHAAPYDRIRDVCLESLRMFAPPIVQNLSIVEFARLYVFKQMRIMCSKDEDNCWVLVSTNNTVGKTIDLLFVHKMRRRFIFPTDSFRIILEDRFLAAVQHAREMVPSPSCANVPSVPIHVQIPAMSIGTSSHASGEGKQNGHVENADDEDVAERLAHIHPTDEGGIEQTQLNDAASTGEDESRQPEREESRDPERREEDNDQNRSATATDSQTTTTPAKEHGRGRRKRRRRRRKSQSQSRPDVPSNKREERSAGSAPPETSVSAPANERRRPQRTSGHQASSHIHRRGVSLDGANGGDMNGFGDGDDEIATRKAQSLPPTFETETSVFSARSGTPPGTMAYLPATASISVQTDVSDFYDDSSMRGSSTASLPPGRSAIPDSSGIAQYSYASESTRHPNWNSWVREGDHFRVESLALFESYETCKEDLCKSRIRFYRPEEVRGGGLLKYCELWQRGFKLCHEQRERKTYYEQLILNRFVNIDYVDRDEQRQAISNFLMRHFRNRTVEALHFLMRIQLVVEQLQSISDQYKHSGHSLLEIVQMLVFALRSALQQHHHNAGAYSSLGQNGSTSSSTTMSAHRRGMTAPTYGMPRIYPYSMYPASGYHTSGYAPMYRSTVGMVAQAQPQYQHYHHQHWSRPPYQQSQFISVTTPGTYGFAHRSNHRYEDESKEEDVPRRRKTVQSRGHRNGHHGRYNNQTYPHQTANGRHRKSSN